MHCVLIILFDGCNFELPSKSKELNASLLPLLLFVQVLGFTCRLCDNRMDTFHLHLDLQNSLLDSFNDLCIALSQLLSLQQSTCVVIIAIKSTSCAFIINENY